MDELFDRQAQPLEAGGPRGSGGNPWLDAVSKADPQFMTRLFESAMMDPKAGYKHVYGKDLPWSIPKGNYHGIGVFLSNPETHAWHDTHTALRGMLGEQAVKSQMDPFRGMSLQDAAKWMGKPVEEFALPSQIKSQTPIPSVMARNVEVPPTFDVDQLQHPGPFPRATTGALPSDVMRQGSRNLSSELGLPTMKYELDPLQPVTSAQRVDMQSEAHQRSLRLPSVGTGGGVAVARARLYADTLGLAPGSPEHSAAMNRFLTGEAIYGAPEKKRLIESRTDVKDLEGDMLEAKLPYAHDKARLEVENLQSQISSRSERDRRMAQLDQSLIDLRKTQTLLNQGRAAGTLPEHELRARMAEEKINHQRLIEMLILMSDKLDLATEQGKDYFTQMALQYYVQGGGQNPRGFLESILQKFGDKFGTPPMLTPGPMAPPVRIDPRDPLGRREQAPPSPVAPPPLLQRPPAAPPAVPAPIGPQSGMPTQPAVAEKLDELEKAATVHAGKHTDKLKPGDTFKLGGVIYSWDGKTARKVQ